MVPTCKQCALVRLKSRPVPCELKEWLFFSIDAGGQYHEGSEEDKGICHIILTAVSFILFICTLPFSLCFCVKVGTIGKNVRASMHVKIQSLQSFTRVAVSLDGFFDKNRTFKRKIFTGIPNMVSTMPKYGSRKAGRANSTF